MITRGGYSNDFEWRVLFAKGGGGGGGWGGALAPP